jgi:hypothetical protein
MITCIRDEIEKDGWRMLETSCFEMEAEVNMMQKEEADGEMRHSEVRGETSLCLSDEQEYSAWTERQEQERSEKEDFNWKLTEEKTAECEGSS